MEPMEQWLSENPDLKDRIPAAFAHDSRLSGMALPDALLNDPALLADMAKEITCEAIRRDAPIGVPEELLEAARRMTKGSGSLSPFVRQTLRDLTGLRDQSEIEPILMGALQYADEADKPKIEGMLDVVRKSSSIDTLMTETGDGGELGFAPIHCVACCALGCIVLPKVCPIACVVGCVVCGSVDV